MVGFDKGAAVKDPLRAMEFFAQRAAREEKWREDKRAEKAKADAARLEQRGFSDPSTERSTPAENEARRERLRMVAERHGTGAASAAIAFALATGATVVVVGCGSVEHLQDAVRGSTVGLVEEEVTFLKTGRVA